MLNKQPSLLMNNSTNSREASIWQPFPMSLCDTYMPYFDYKLLNKIKINCWLMYFDDTFILDDNYISILYILNVVTSIDPNIQFTVESKRWYLLCYLHVLITKLKFPFNFPFSEKHCWCNASTNLTMPYQQKSIILHISAPRAEYLFWYSHYLFI